jgi:hypothetical protein
VSALCVVCVCVCMACVCVWVLCWFEWSFGSGVGITLCIWNTVPHPSPPKNIVVTMFRRTSRFVKSAAAFVGRRNFGAGHGHGHDPKPGHIDLHEPTIHKNVAYVLHTFMWFWVFVRFKDDKGMAFGFYEPWKEAHEHHADVDYEEDEDGNVILIEHEHHDDHGHH